MDDLILLLKEIEIMINKDETKKMGLMDGYAGKALFYSCLFSQYKNNRFQSKSNKLLNDALELPSSNNYYSYAQGLPGIIWVINHLNTEKSMQKLDLEISHALIAKINFLIENSVLNSFDPLYGYLGLGKSLINCHNTSLIKKGIEMILANLNSEKKEVNGFITWTLEVNDQETAQYYTGTNFSLAHGTIGILLFLIEVFSRGFEQELCRKLVISHINYILNFENPLTKCSRFSPSDTSQDYSIRLAWCHGDLGIAYVLIKAGIAFSIPEFVTKGIEISRYNLNRSFKDTGVNSDSRVGGIDSSLCHGTGSIALMYRRIAILTKEIDFRIMADHWFDITVKLATKAIKKKKYKAYFCDEDIHCGLLSGMTGIGLLILSFIDADLSEWENCMYL